MTTIREENITKLREALEKAKDAFVDANTRTMFNAGAEETKRAEQAEYEALADLINARELLTDATFVTNETLLAALAIDDPEGENMMALPAMLKDITAHLQQVFAEADGDDIAVELALQDLARGFRLRRVKATLEQPYAFPGVTLMHSEQLGGMQ